MLGSLLSRALIMAFGYAYPAYQCYKSVEMNKPDIENLRFWCQYWILVALITVVERIGDIIISWLPMYNEAKLAFFIYLWHPKAMGTTYIYNGFFQPYISQHESNIDQNLMELRVRAADAVFTFWRQGAMYGQARFFEILQYFAAQSQSLRVRPYQRKQEEEQQQQRQVNHPPPIIPAREPATRQKKQPQQQEQFQPQEQQQTTSMKTAQQPIMHQVQQDEHPDQEYILPRVVRSRAHFSSAQEQQPIVLASSSPPKSRSFEVTTASAAVAPLVSSPDEAAAEAENGGAENEREVTTLESPVNSENETDANPAEEVMEETIRVTRARLRKNLSSRADPEAGI